MCFVIAYNYLSSVIGKQSAKTALVEIVDCFTEILRTRTVLNLDLFLDQLDQLVYHGGVNQDEVWTYTYLSEVHEPAHNDFLCCDF